MLSPEKNQISICLLKSNLEDIENDLVEQWSACPKLDAENKQKCRDSMKALQVMRALSSEMERLNQENVKLASKRMQLKRQSDELGRALERALKNRAATEDELKREEQQIEEQVRKYEDSLRETADRLRRTRAYYNEAEMSAAIAKVNMEISELENLVSNGRGAVEGLRKELGDLEPAVPEDLLILIGKNELYEKLKTVTEKCASLQHKRNKLRK